MSTLWRIIGASPSGINKEILFHMAPRIPERGLRWAPRSLLSADSNFAIRRSVLQEDRGFLATKGLVVELAGFRISMAKPAKGLPKHLSGFDPLPRDHFYRNHLLLNDWHGRWYLLDHHLSSTWSGPPPLEEMHAVISGLSSPWILYRGTSSPVPEYQTAYHGLLVEQANEQQWQNKTVPCVETKSHVGFGHVTKEISRICQAAYCLAQELTESAAAHRIEDLKTALIDVENPAYQEAIQDLHLEVLRLSKSPFAMEALVASGKNGDEQRIGELFELVMLIYRGLYIQIEEYVPGSRKWCVD